MVKGWPQLSPRGVITAVNAVRRMSSKVGRTSREEVTRKLGRTVTLIRRPRNRRCRGEIEQYAKIETLPEEILLEIFDCTRLAVATDSDSDKSDDPSSSSSAGPNWSPWEWHRLAHVCRRWRFLVFASPHRLDLRVVYTFNRPARLRKTTLDSWPTLPIAVWYPCQNAVRGRSVILEDENNAAFALRHPRRIREINLFLTHSLLSKSKTQVLASFPALEYLRLESQYSKKTTLVLPVGFLGGSAPRLRDIQLTGVSFPTLPLLLLSTRNLVSLRIDKVPRRGYFSPEALSIGLSMTTQLKSLRLHFHPFASNVSESSVRPLTTRVILPSLYEFHFAGDGAYLEDLISRIDAPALERLDLTFYKPDAFETLQLSQFIARTESLATPHQMSILLLGDEILVVNRFHPSPSVTHFQLHITTEEIGLQVTLPHILLTRLSALLTGVQRLDMTSFLPWSPWLDTDDMESPLWLDFFRNLKSVTRLEVAGVFVPTIESTLEQLSDDMVRRVLPALHDLYVGRGCVLDGPIQKFADARKSSGRPLTVHLLPMENSYLTEGPDYISGSLES